MPGETLLNQRYELVAQQGSGGMSVIYRALDRSLGRIVAIKILRPNLTNDPAFLAKFQQEARSIAKMAHPNIVTVHDVGSDGATYYIVMEMISGSDLKRLIKQRGALPLDKALDYAIQICAGLGFAHRSRLVHADVKPQNILINREGVVKVTDFGIAQAYTDTMPQTRSQVVWGSPHYFAPEQARGEKPSPASDVYSIGIVLFEMFTGRLPFVGASQRELALAHLKADVPRAREINPDLPEELSRVIYQGNEQAPKRPLPACRPAGADYGADPRPQPREAAAARGHRAAAARRDNPTGARHESHAAGASHSIAARALLSPRRQHQCRSDWRLHRTLHPAASRTRRQRGCADHRPDCAGFPGGGWPAAGLHFVGAAAAVGGRGSKAAAQARGFASIQNSRYRNDRRRGVSLKRLQENAIFLQERASQRDAPVRDY